MKRARDSTDAQACVQRNGRTAFASSLNQDSSGFVLSVRLPDEVVAASSVLTELSKLDGAPALEQEPERSFALLAWLAQRQCRTQTSDISAVPPPWDAEVDAFNVRLLLLEKFLGEQTGFDAYYEALCAGTPAPGTHCICATLLSKR